MQIEILVVGQLSTNCYLVFCEEEREALIIDPGDAADYIMARMRDLSLAPKAIIATHGHFDHILAVTELKLAYNIPFYLHKADLPILKRTQKTAKYFLGMGVDPPTIPNKYLKEGMNIKFGQEILQVLETPGHTQGSVCLYDAKKHLFVGDTIFAGGGQGRTDLEGGNQQKLFSSIKKILKFPQETIIFPGHGKISTIGEEMRFYNFEKF